VFPHYKSQNLNVERTLLILYTSKGTSSHRKSPIYQKGRAHLRNRAWGRKRALSEGWEVKLFREGSASEGGEEEQSRYTNPKRCGSRSRSYGKEKTRRIGKCKRVGGDRNDLLRGSVAKIWLKRRWARREVLSQEDGEGKKKASDVMRRQLGRHQEQGGKRFSGDS